MTRFSMLLLLAGCGHAVAFVDTSDPGRVRMGCMRFAIPSGWQIREANPDGIVLQTIGAATNGDMILIDSESAGDRRLEEWVNATTNEGSLPGGLAYHETRLRGEKAWLAESKATPIQYFVTEGGGRFFHVRKMRGDRESFERLWKSIEFEGCTS